MATFKNPFDGPREFPRYDLRADAGQTFEVPDEDATDFEAQGYTPVKTKSPDVTIDPAVAEAATAVVDPTILPAAPAA